MVALEETVWQTCIAHVKLLRAFLVIEWNACGRFSRLWSISWFISVAIRETGTCQLDAEVNARLAICFMIQHHCSTILFTLRVVADGTIQTCSLPGVSGRCFGLLLLWFIRRSTTWQQDCNAFLCDCFARWSLRCSPRPPYTRFRIEPMAVRFCTCSVQQLISVSVCARCSPKCD